MIFLKKKIYFKSEIFKKSLKIQKQFIKRRFLLDLFNFVKMKILFKNSKQKHGI